MKRPVIIFLDSPAALSISKDGKFLEQTFTNRGSDQYKIDECDFLFLSEHGAYDETDIAKFLRLPTYPEA